MASVADIQQSMEDLLTQYNAEAQSFLSTLSANLEYSSDIDVPGTSPSYFSGNASFSDVTRRYPDRPDDIEYEAVSDPGAPPTLAALPVIDVVSDLPSYDLASPEVSIPSAPTFTLPAEPVSPSIDGVVLPTKPVYTLPTVPTLASVQMPDSPGFSWPSYQAAFPVEPDLTLRVDTFAWSEEVYSSDVIDAVQAKLLGDLENGGYGIEPADEEALWARAKDRETQALRAEEQQIDSRVIAAGWRLPTGILAALRQRALQDALGKLNETHREIFVTRADLFRKAREFAINKGIDLETLLINYWGARQERAFNAAKMTAEFSVVVLNALIARYNIQLQAYQTYTDGYKARVEAILAQVQAYKTEVDAALAKFEANKTEVELYRAQLEAVNTLVNLYTAEMQSARIGAEIENLKLERFKAMVSAYVAQVDAKKTIAQLFESQVRGELAKVEVFKSQVEAYTTQVNAVKAKADVKIADLEARIKQQTLTLGAYQASLEKYRADIAAETARVNSITGVYEADSRAFAAFAQAWSALQDVGVREMDLIKTSAIEASKVNQQKAAIEIKKLEAEAEIRGDAAKAGAGIYQELLKSIGAQVSGLLTQEGS